MGRAYRTIGGLVAAIIVAAVGFIVMSERVLPFSESLQRQDSLEEEVGPSRSSISLRFANEDQTVTLASEVMVTELDNGRYQVSVRSSHTEGGPTHLDALRLRLDPGQPVMPEVALKTPGGNPWEPIRFSRSDDGQGVVLDIPDLGYQGTGTVSLDFIIGPYESGETPESIWLDYDARIYEEGAVNLTAYEAEALVEVPMPTGDESALDPASPASWRLADRGEAGGSRPVHPSLTLSRRAS